MTEAFTFSIRLNNDHRIEEYLVEIEAEAVVGSAADVPAPDNPAPDSPAPDSPAPDSQ